MAWRLSAAQWDVLTEMLQLAGWPAPIQVRSHGRTDFERGRLRAEVDVELRQLGLVRAGRVQADLEAALHLLHRPARWLDSVWLPDAAAHQPVRVLAAGDATVGVCALQHPDQPGATMLEVLPTSGLAASGLAAAVVSRLPAHPPGPGVLRESPAGSIALAPSPERPGGVLVSASPVRSSVERERAAVSAILDQPHVRAGQIAANARDSAGRVRRSQVVRWCDNPEGRYQITLTDRPDTRSLTVAPADPHRLVTTLQHLLDSVH